MIKSFSHKGLEVFYKTGSTKGIQANHANKIARVLFAIAMAKYIEDLNAPGFRLHKLKGNM